MAANDSSESRSELEQAASVSSIGNTSIINNRRKPRWKKKKKKRGFGFGFGSMIAAEKKKKKKWEEGLGRIGEIVEDE